MGKKPDEIRDEAVESTGGTKGVGGADAFSNEIARRVAEIDAGTATLIPAEESFARAQAALKDARRSSRRG